MGNSASDYTIIRVRPTIDFDADGTDNTHAVDDLVFAPTEIPNAVLGNGGCSELLACYMVDYSNQNTDYRLIFTENTASVTTVATGGLNTTVNISVANLRTLAPCGMMVNDGEDTNLSSSSNDIDNARIHTFAPQTESMDGTAPSKFLIQAAAGSSSVYVFGIIKAGTPDYTAVDQLELVLHIKKR
tara:strand:+ start:1177 stop:1734 length:558 start_codon:yes stop_codon:yes gene_type:complete